MGFDIWLGPKNLDTFDWRKAGIFSADKDDDDLAAASEGTVKMLGFNPFDTQQEDTAGANDYFLYHGTSGYKGLNIVKTGKLRLPLAATNSSERALGTPKNYYMSFARTLASGYLLDKGPGNSIGTNAIFIFDSRVLQRSRGVTLRSTDYWNNSDGSGRQMGRAKEAEERLYSDNPEVNVAKAIVEIRLFVKDDDWMDKWLLEMVIDAKKKGIKVKLFTEANYKGIFHGRETKADRQAALDALKKHGLVKESHDSMQAYKASSLRKRDPKGYAPSQMQRLQELVHKKKYVELSERAQSDLRNARSRWDDKGLLGQFSNDIHNMRAGRPEEQDRFNRAMKAMKAKDVDDLFAKLDKKWLKLYEEYQAEEQKRWEAEYAKRQAAEDEADPERARLRALREKQTAEAEARILANQKSIWGEAASFDDEAYSIKIPSGNLSLRLTRKIEQENLYQYRIDIMNASTQIGEILLDSEDGVNFRIDIFDLSESGTDGDLKNRLGVAGLKGLLVQLRRIIPGMRTIKGYRSTGARKMAKKPGSTKAIDVMDISALDNIDVAVIKPKSEYRLYTYSGSRTLKFPFKRGRSVKDYTLKKGEKFGLRTSTTTTAARMFLDKVGISHVFTPAPEKVRFLLKHSTGNERDTVELKGKGGAVEHVTSIREALGKAFVAPVQKHKSFFKLSGATVAPWRLLAQWMTLHKGVKVTPEQLYAYDRMRGLLHADKLSELKNPEPLRREIVAGAMAIKKVLGRMPKEKELVMVLRYILAIQKGTRKPAVIPALEWHSRRWQWNGKIYKKV